MLLLFVSLLAYVTFAGATSQEAEDAAILREVYGEQFKKLGRNAEEVEKALAYLESFIFQEDDADRALEEEDHAFTFTEEMGNDYRELLEAEDEWTNEEFDGLLSEINEREMNPDHTF